MVGSGFYLSPSAVAPYGVLAILAWIVMGIGAICLGLTFARLARIAPATGGPYAYTRMAYGDFAGFLIAWGYWISIWASLPAIAFAFAGAVMNLAPERLLQQASGVDPHARRDLVRGADQPARREDCRHLRGGDDVHQARALRRHRPGRIVLRSQREPVRVQSQRRIAARLVRGARAAHDVRLPRPRVGDGAGGRRARPSSAPFPARPSSASASPRCSTCSGPWSCSASCRGKSS